MPGQGDHREVDRRELLRAALGAGVALGTLARSGTASADDSKGENAAGAPVPPADVSPDALAADEAFWGKVRALFPQGSQLVNLNHGGASPTPRPVLEAVERGLEAGNVAPAHTLWRVLEPRVEEVRKRLAAAAGCSPDELAVTRNASESLAICQLGIPLAAGDEAVTTEQDYPRTLVTWGQRARRDGIVLRTVAGAAPDPGDDELVARFEKAIGPKTKVLLFCHVTGMTGRILPVRRICQLARARGVQTIVDGAHGFGQVPTNLADLDCDYYATSLHKWLQAPHGTGFLFVRRERLPALWPLMAAPPEKDADIRKLEEIGTHPPAAHNAVALALDFHERLGLERKAARLRFLRDRWIRRLAKLPGARIHESPSPLQAPAIGYASFARLEAGELFSRLLSKHGIVVSPVSAGGVSGIRVTPGISTSVEEVDRLCAAVEQELG